jgi:trans-aconitate methyltransferase
MPEAGASLFAKADGYYQSEREDMLRFVPACAKKVVEFGCGEGRFAAMVKERFGAEVWAVEIDERCAEIAASQLDKVICGDATESVDRLPDGCILTALSALTFWSTLWILTRCCGC